MSLYQKILLCNVFRHKFSSYSYFLFFSICICYFFIYSRYNQIPETRFTFEFQEKKLEPATSPIKSSNSTESRSQSTEHPSMKYILLWTNPKNFPFIYLGEGRSVFERRSCKWTNCYVTADRTFLGSYTEFDVIAFNGPQLSEMLVNRDWPKERFPRQKYVYANIESATNFPIRTNVFNAFFNWTWTYKLNSDAFWGYIAIRDSEKKVIGPQQIMHWKRLEDMAPVKKEIKQKLKTKEKTAAWMCSTKDSLSHREDYVEALKQYLGQYNLKVDTYGECGDHQCPKEIMSRCLRMIEKRYYFYLAFENSFCDDYVTEKVLYALNHNTVPIVYGGANYSRFLPPGSYLEAAVLGPKKLAKTMVHLIENPSEYSQFFRWRSHYSVHAPSDSPETDSYCNFCAALNNETLMKTHTIYERFNAWWMNKVMRVL